MRRALSALVVAVVTVIARLLVPPTDEDDWEPPR